MRASVAHRALLAAALLAPLLGGCRQDMHNQAKYKPFAQNPFFADDRASRPLVAGVVARGHLDEDEAFFKGVSSGAPVATNPLGSSREVLLRGQERFNIYCAPCHGYDGQGHGTVPTRLEQVGKAWAVANLTDPSKVVLPNGQIFNTISNGRNTMRGYGSQIPVEDRWAIVLYVRALQRGQHPGPGDRP